MVKMIEHRNVFAHRMLDETNTLLPHITRDKTTIRFLKFKDEVSPLDYTEDGFANIIRCIQNIANHFYNHKFEW